VDQPRQLALQKSGEKSVVILRMEPSAPVSISAARETIHVHHPPPREQNFKSTPPNGYSTCLSRLSEKKNIRISFIPHLKVYKSECRISFFLICQLNGQVVPFFFLINIDIGSVCMYLD
jgi:hypothetical protein